MSKFGYDKSGKYIDLKINGRLFPSWVMANFKKYKLDDILLKLDKCNDIFFKKANYLENLNNNKDKNFYKDEVEILETYKNCMFLKNNNFRKTIK